MKPTHPAPTTLPGFKRDKASVSWHADSSLDHFSSIAVYHTTDAADEAATDWRIALRVQHDAEVSRHTEVNI